MHQSYGLQNIMVVHDNIFKFGITFQHLVKLVWILSWLFRDYYGDQEAVSTPLWSQEKVWSKLEI